MRLDFNVLWVDDQPDRVNAQITAIQRKMVEQGFAFIPKICKSMDEVRGIITDTVFTDEIDLILVDWDLGSGIKGQEAIAEIRETIQYKDVVFYSAQPAVDLRKAAFDKGLEGVYCANREQLIDEVMGVFESLVKKVLDLDHTRGIVMGATSDIDHIVNQCLRFSVNLHLDADGKKEFFKIALEYVKKQTEEFSKQAQLLENSTNLDEFLKAHMVLTSDYRLRILGKLLKLPIFTSYKDYRDAVVAYQQEVIPKRNRLGHIKFTPQGKSKEIFDGEGKSMGLDETRNLRRAILELRGQFRQLHDALESVAKAAASPTPPEASK